MNKILCVAIVLVLVNVTSCKKEDAAPVAPAFTLAAIAGTWVINPSQAVEWVLGLATSSKANEPTLLNATLKIVGTEVQVKDSSGASMGSFPISVNESGMTVTIIGVGTFDVKNYVGNVSMTWEQQDPSGASEYEEVAPGVFVFNQKFWGLTKQL